MGNTHEKFWFVGIVHTNTERSTSLLLEQMGLQTYVPEQQRISIRPNGRRVKSMRVVIPGIVFIYCSEEERKKMAVRAHTLRRFMMDRAGSAPRPAIVSQSEIEKLRFMVGQSEIPVEFEAGCYAVGQRVCVVRGRLKGIEGIVARMEEGSSELMVRLDALGCAKLLINNIDLQPADEES